MAAATRSTPALPQTISAVAIESRDRLLAVLAHLAARPAALFAVLWTASALKFPYGSLVHDARLYAFQVQNQMSGGAFGSDLFLRFGSQDKFTPFSRVMAPVVAVFGVDWTFLVLFLISNALLIFALQRLITAIIDDGVVAAAGLLAAICSPMPYGGLRIFHVSENFFTPRQMSCAVALFALERILRQRYASGLALAVVATIIHPLMGFGAVAVGLSSAVLDRLPRRAVLPAIAAAGAVAITILAYRPLGTVIFGTLDPEWLEIVRNASAYNFPGFWTGRDWVNVALSLGIPLGAAASMSGESPQRARFLYVSVALGAVGLVTMFVAGAAPYRVLLQGQPYRIMWILSAIQIPMAFWLAVRVWPEGLAGRLAAILLIASPELAGLFVPELLFSMLAIGAFLVILNRPASTIGFTGSLVPSVAGGLAVGFLASALLNVYLIGSRAPELLSLVGVKLYADIMLGAPGPMVWVAMVLGGLALMTGGRSPGRAVAAVAAVLVVAIHFVMFLIPRVPGLREAEIPYGRDLPFIQSHFEHRPHDSTAPSSVYVGIWNSSTLVWFDLQATSYFNLVQLSGVLFNRETAIEGRRRAAIVRPFEMERYKVIAEFIPWADKLMITSLFGPPEQTSPPTRADLLRLCGAEEPIDVAILKNDFGDLASATNGRVYLYDCAHVRTVANGN